MQPYYIFLDVDGTLVTYNNELPESAVGAIKAAQANGHKVFTVTGRSKAEMYEDILDIGFDGYIGGNGSYIETDEHVIADRKLSAKDTRMIVDWLYENGLEFYLEGNIGLFASERFEVEAERPLQLYAAKKGKEQPNQVRVKDVFPEMIFGEQPYRNDINKISFILNAYEDYLKAKDQFSNFKVGTWGGVGETALFGDISLKNINKSSAIQQLLNHFGASNEATIAFGDAKVDIPMLEHCSIGVAMGNGGPEIKNASDYITDDVEQDGLYKAFKYFDLI
ncbi:hypothetical protein SAMN04488102_11065 [Alkalibacterium subtropicum]|uniref:Cof subfamily of IIB subfamily of haloacid dehalogenase superfamily/HAD-superfamily hydrolase, subfamily IIB n=1 Tax=Alkalibacterium subtropicum TaxID=753702 RepID=A0A1I1K5Z4_9LACT|nr:Cof-type HAD-IIB family hydrolase [Alkalibacterium subtropicum]SFC56035.1 hypothetical protein SAMN04488102_11065 [Alkalibacterium subtropicum]